MRILLIISICLTIISCSSFTEPERQDYTSEQCYRAAWCQWQNANSDNHDMDCTDAEKECRAFDKYIFCKCLENRWPGHTEEDCWKQLNQK